MTQLSLTLLVRVALVLTVLCGVVQAQTQLPIFLLQPQSRTTTTGSMVAFDVVVEDMAATRFQWRLNGADLPGENQPTLSLTNVQPIHAGIYTVVAYNEAGAVNSSPAELRLSNVPFMQFSDAFSASPTIDGPAGLFTSSNVGATAETGEPPHFGKPARRSVWVKWIAPAGGIASLSTRGSTFDTIIAVYTGDSLGELVEVASDDDTDGFFAGRVRFRAQPQTIYHIAVDGFGGAGGRIQLAWHLEITTETLPVIGKEPVDQTVAPGSDVAFTVEASTQFSYQWFFNGNVLSNATSPTLALKDVRFDDVGFYFCRVSNGVRFRDTRPVSLQLNINELGITDPRARSVGKWFEAREQSGVPGRDTAKSVAHGYSGTQVFSTLAANKEAGEPNHCGIAGGASEWFAYQAEGNGTLFINTDGSNFDTVLAVYTGPGDSFATLVPAACDNDSGLDGKDSRVSFQATAGTIYWVAVDGVNHPSTGVPARGTVRLNFRLVLPLQLTATAYTNTAGGRLTFRVNGTPNLAAVIQLNTNMNSTNWVSLFTNSHSSGNFNYTNTGAAAVPQRFFRAVNRF